MATIAAVAIRMKAPDQLGVTLSDGMQVGVLAQAERGQRPPLAA